MSCTGNVLCVRANIFGLTNITGNCESTRISQANHSLTAFLVEQLGNSKSMY